MKPSRCYSQMRGYLVAAALTALLSFSSTSAQTFTRSQLNGASFPFDSDNGKCEMPTSLQFGPDGRLYVMEVNGLIKIFNVVRNGPNNYSVTATEVVSLIHDIPNHDDSTGAVNASVAGREATNILVVGTAANPVIYASSSDPRRGQGGSSPDTGQDTNSGIISRLTWNGTSWSKIDLVRGLPKSKTSHASNGLALDAQNNVLYLAQGSETNCGAPGTYSARNCEYAYSAAILSINLTAIDAMPTQGSGNTAFKYDLPTLDDPNRTNNPDGSDPNDPFGGDHGLNQAKIVSGSPVQIYAYGTRNPYKVIITKTPGKSRRMYVIDNGPDNGIGPLPDGTGQSGCNVTNHWPSSTDTSQTYSSREKLYYIGNIDSYTPGTFYGGHPNPIRANPSGAGLFTDDGTNAVYRSSTSGQFPLPADWPPFPVNMADCRQGFYLEAGTHDPALLTFDTTPEGFTEYTASNFGGSLKGVLFAASFDGFVLRLNLSADGVTCTNSKSASEKLNQDPPFDSGLAGSPVNITAEGDNDPFPGTMWMCAYFFNGSSSYITVYEPSDYGTSGSPTPTPTPSGQAVVSYTLVNADNAQDIQTLNDGDVINLARTPSQNLNIRANTSPATVGSVVMILSGTQSRNHIENAAPYSLFGDNGSGTYFPWTPAVGPYTLQCTPFTGSNGSGTAGTALTINFTVTMMPPTITAVTQSSNGHVIIMGQAAPSSSIGIQASPDLITSFGTIGSVNADTNGAFQYEDVNAANYTERFYRARYQ